MSKAAIDERPAAQQGTNSNTMILSARNIHKRYEQGDLHILKGIDIDVQKGDVVSIVGPSGAGKSTLLHILGGLDKPNDGTVILNGKDVYAINDADRARLRNEQIGFVFQFYHLLPELNALENVILPAMILSRGGKTAALESRGAELLEKVGLKHRMTHRSNALSGGEQQRVAIARALVNSPNVVLCDEPTGNLDSKSGDAIIEILLNLNKTEKQTLVMVTHDEKVAQKSHKIIPIRDGKLER
jgi:lipoprotein-releasing system ATP-binding protein